MAQIYGELIRAQLQVSNGDLSSPVIGLVYFNNDPAVAANRGLKVHDGSAWQKLVTESYLAANSSLLPIVPLEKGGLGLDATAITGLVRISSPGGVSAGQITVDDIPDSTVLYSKLDLANGDIPQAKVKDLVTDLGNKVAANSAIVAATKTKITYDAKGLVTAGADLASDDIPATLLEKVISSTSEITGALTLPVGTTADRTGLSTQGMVRYNTTLATFEGHNGTDWGAIGGAGAGGTTDQFTQASPVLAVGDVVYLNGSVYTKAIASAANTAEVVGVISKDPSTLGTDKYEITLSGEVTGLTGLVAGEVYFLSADTAGALTVTEPTVVGQVSLPVGVASSTTSLYVAPKRGAVVGSSNARTQIALANNATTTVQNISAYDAGELTGWISITATTPLRFYVAAQFSKNGAANNYNVSYQVSGDTVPTGFSVTATAAGLLQVTLPSVTGFASASINYALNAPAVGTTFPLNIDGNLVTTATTSSPGVITIKQPTQTRLLSGSGTYNTPAGVLYLKIRMVGGGAGGTGGGTGTSGGNGSNGNPTTFGTSLLTANGGTNGNYVYAGVGGSATINAPAVGIAIRGGCGGPSNVGMVNPIAGSGGNTPFGGGGAGQVTAGLASFAGSTNSGGGGGGGTSGAASGMAGGGGGAGGYIEATISSPSASYSYSVGSGGNGGSAGTSGSAGAAGGSGIIIIDEFYY